MKKTCETERENIWDTYHIARNNCNAKVEEVKPKYHHNLTEENKSNPRKFWDAVKRVLPFKSKTLTGSSTKNLKKKLSQMNCRNTLGMYSQI